MGEEQGPSLWPVPDASGHSPEKGPGPSPGRCFHLPASRFHLRRSLPSPGLTRPFREAASPEKPGSPRVIASHPGDFRGFPGDLTKQVEAQKNFAHSSHFGFFSFLRNELPIRMCSRLSHRDCGSNKIETKLQAGPRGPVWLYPPPFN